MEMRSGPGDSLPARFRAVHPRASAAAGVALVVQRVGVAAAGARLGGVVLVDLPLALQVEPLLVAHPRLGVGVLLARAGGRAHLAGALPLLPRLARGGLLLRLVAFHL